MALDARMAGHTGIGRYQRELLKRLPVDGVVPFLNPDQDAAWVPPGMEVRRFRAGVPVYSFREWTAWTGMLEGFDLLHVPHFNAPWSPPIPMVVTIHDAIYWRFPANTGSWLGGRYARFMLKRSVERAERVIAVSEATRHDVLGLLGGSPDRVETVLSGAPEPEPNDARGEYVLYVGNALPHKRLDVLFKAVRTLRTQGRDLPLVLVGATTSMEGVRCLGSLDDAALRETYRKARVLVSPSPWEGFGFPALEALSQGVPVVAVDSGASPEVLRGGALYVKPGDAAGMAQAILGVWADEGLRAALLEAGRRRLGELRWEETARGTLEAYRRALSAGQP